MVDVPADFQWHPEHEHLLEDIALNDTPVSDWKKLRDIIKYKLSQNIAHFLFNTRQPDPPSPFPPIQLPHGGLKLAPFPPRKFSQMHINDPPVSHMNESQANYMKEQILTQLDEFDLTPPFTIQRVCELCVNPTQHYTSLGKYLRAVEKSILVTSTWEDFIAPIEGDFGSSFSGTIGYSATLQSAPSTPLFSPIAFLHDDARRSKSRSPPPTPLSLGPVASISEGHLDALETKTLGLVDELDDPSPGHLSEHPTALSSVTTLSEHVSGRERPPSLFGSLEQRFVGGSVETVGGTLMEGLEDSRMLVDDDKENSKA